MSETRLRELLADYVADEPPLALRVDDVLAAAARPASAASRVAVGRRGPSRMPWLAAAAAVLLVVGGVGWGFTRGERGPGLPGSGDGATGAVVGPTARTPASEMLSVLAEVALGLDRGGSVLRSLSQSWKPDSSGAASDVTPDQATEWLVQTASARRILGAGVQISARIVPPDAPESVRTGGVCAEANAAVTRCRTGTLPDGRTYVEHYDATWPELSSQPRLQRHAVTVISGDVQVTAAQLRTSPSGVDLDMGWSIAVELLQTAAADLRLVPPRPSVLPGLPSYLACWAAPTTPGCPNAASLSTATGAVPTGLPTRSPGGAPIAGRSAAAVMARMKELVSQTLGAGARSTVVARHWSYIGALVEREYPWATGVVGDSSNAADDTYLTIVAEYQSIVAEYQSPEVSQSCRSEPDVIECRVLHLADGRDAQYSVRNFGPDRNGRQRLSGWVEMVDGGLHVRVMETALSAPGATAAPPRSRLTLTPEQLLALAADPGIHLAPPVEWPDPDKGFCRPDASGATVCSTLTGG